MYDIVVVGAGHAGCEAALACAKMGLKTLLVTGNLDMCGSMPCNPSIGGPAKGVVVREIDALGGYMGKNADLCQIQTKLLNSSKGPAVWALRFQEDKLLYVKEMRKHLEKTPNLDLLEAIVMGLNVADNKVCGIVLEDGKNIECKKVILTTGTYLNSRILRGKVTLDEGPDSQRTSYGISKQLKELGFEIQRLKTGTPARIYTDSIDFSKTKLEAGDAKTRHFSFDPGYESILGVNVPCYLTYTDKELHNYILEHLNDSAMYGGVAKGIGPRYCPSIEDKIVRFKDKDRHQIFFEPESLELDETYIQGFSTSMSVEVQDKMIHMLKGLENARVKRYAYAIEYDAINPLNIYPTLETKFVKGLYTAGQINGTSGYEEAAGQGLIAGINAASSILGKKPLILKRDEAYIGVMIDDLVTKGTNEPYRLLTSRAEYRLLLRHDNADLRLREYGRYYGLIDDAQYSRFIVKKEKIAFYYDRFKADKIKVNFLNNYFVKKGIEQVKESTTIYNLLKRPDLSIIDILNICKTNNIYEDLNDVAEDVLEQIEISIKYEGYIAKTLAQAEKMRIYENKIIPLEIDYDKIQNLALEAREKLKKVRPQTIGQATRISGVNPADITVLIIYLEAYYGK